jgi:hypothetical protein
MKILIIPDTQVKPGVPIAHMKWAAKAIRDYLTKDDYVVHLGDHWDFPSLSSYSSRREIEGKRVLEDIEAGNKAMDLFWKTLKPMKKKPQFHLHGGNHEYRLTRYVDDNPVLEGVLSEESLNRDGWIYHPFKEVNEIGGVYFTHYFYAPYTGRAYGGTAHNILRNVGLSFVQGHRQGKDVASRTLPTGTVQRALICGSCYLHKEDYLGPQAKESWQGVVVLNGVENGDYDLMELSLKYLCRKYEKMDLDDFISKESANVR